MSHLIIEHNFIFTVNLFFYQIKSIQTKPEPISSHSIYKMDLCFSQGNEFNPSCSIRNWACGTRCKCVSYDPMSIMWHDRCISWLPLL